MKIRPVEAEVFDGDRRTWGRKKSLFSVLRMRLKMGRICVSFISKQKLVAPCLRQFTAKFLLHYKASQCGICSGKTGIETSFTPSPAAFLCQHRPTSVPYSFTALCSTR